MITGINKYFQQDISLYLKDQAMTMKQSGKPPKQFNPFEDRLSRDIRNDLSESIIEVLSSRSLGPAERAAEKYTATELPPIYREYIKYRLKQYGEALAKILSADDNILKQAGLLWDLALYFEVHEILEPAWLKASGETKLLLQALIRSAGVYINLECGYKDRAAKIAAKAIPVLRRYKDRLQQDLRADELIGALEELSDRAPLLTVDTQ